MTCARFSPAPQLIHAPELACRALFSHLKHHRTPSVLLLLCRLSHY